MNKNNKGQGAPKNDDTAAYWYTTAAEHADADTQFNLGFAYEHGKGVPKNDVTAAYWYKKAAEQGNALAQFNLGFAYENGKGVPKNAVQSARWYGECAAQFILEGAAAADAADVRKATQ